MIGDIIEEQRILLNMTRKELSEGICTEKYIYLIEKNERNPSAYILNNLSERLGIDLFEYYQYLDYENKDLVLEYKEKFERYIQLGDMEKLKEEGLKAVELEDFKREPLSYDIDIIKILHKILVEGKTTEGIKELNGILEIKELNIDNVTLINAYVALSTCYQIEGQFNKAKEAVEVAYEMIKNKAEFSRYRTVIITVLISFISLLYNLKEYDELIKHSNDLLAFQEKYSEYNRIYYVDFYMAIAYYKTNKLSKSKEHFMRGLHSALLFKSKLDMKYIAEIKEFKDVANKLEINQYLLEQFYEVLELPDGIDF